MREPGQAGSFYGRRKGKALRPGHERLVRDLLPKLRVPLPGPDEVGGSEAAPDRGSAPGVASRSARIDPASLFPGPVRALRLEIGFGGGEHLVATARAEPEVGFIGCEPFVNGLAKLLAAAEAEQLGNIRVWDRDATELMAALPDGAIDRVDLLFPDPWPKRRQRKRRFVSDANLAELSRILRPGGAFRFATDIDDYAGWTLARVLRSSGFRWDATEPDDWRRPWPGWPGTRYEAKARQEGRPASYLTFTRV